MTTSTVTLSFTYDLDDRAAYEIEKKGFFEHAIANLPEGRRVKVSFWDPGRLAQDLEMEVKQGHVSLGQPGLIVVSRVTVENMKRAVKEQYENGYFDRLMGIQLSS
jgi:hypothetical protein